MKVSSTHRKLSLKKGFTLIELLAVIAIISVIAVIAVNRYSDVIANARLAKRATVVSVVEKAKDIYAAQETTTAGSLALYNSATDSAKWNTYLKNYVRLNGKVPTDAELESGTGLKIATNLKPGLIKTGSVNATPSTFE
jgi:prepilin-type N-terminal cleavage/methylation domain-containing protein